MSTITAPDTLPRYTHQQIIRVISGILLCILLAALDQTVVIPAVPTIAAEMGAFGHLSWIVSAYLLTSTAATPIYGKLSDTYGRRKLLLLGLVLFILASALCALSRTLTELIVARAIQGLGGAGLMAMSQAAIADVVSPRERGRYQGYMAGAWGVASIAGPVVGGYVTQHLSWRWLFWANLPLGLLALFLCDRGLRGLPVRGGRPQIDGAGAALLVGGVTCWLLLLSSGGAEFAWDSALALGLMAGGLVLLLALGYVEKRARAPILPPHLFRDPIFLGGVSVAFCMSLSLLGATFLLPLWFQLAIGVDPAHSGLLVMPFLAAGVVGAFTAGQLARYFGRTKAIVLTALGSCLAGFATLAIVGEHLPMAVVLIASALVGGGTGATMPSVLVQVQNAADRRDIGAATGCLLFLRSMGGAFGSTAVGALLIARFNAGLQAMGVRHVDLGALRSTPDAAAGLHGISLEAARGALIPGFHLAFGVCGVMTALAFLIAMLMRDQPLRSFNAPQEVGH